MNQEVSDYYNQTQNHYQRWWHLNDGMSLHYGLWFPGTKNFLEALQNTNHYMASAIDIKGDEQVLDAGCGVGGAAIYLAKTYQAKVTGITLSDLQVETAINNAQRSEVKDLTQFYQADYTATSFPDDSFDVVWACESSSSAPDKSQMLKEWYRILKPGGRLIILDFFKTDEAKQYKGNDLAQWSSLWAMSPLVTLAEVKEEFTNSGLNILRQEDLTELVRPTIDRMHRSYWLGLAPSRIYNLLFGARKYARNHYKSGLYQYKSFKKGLWKYHAVIGIKVI